MILKIGHKTLQGAQQDVLAGDTKGKRGRQGIQSANIYLGWELGKQSINPATDTEPREVCTYLSSDVKRAC